ncbi:hypothetical protein BRO20_09580, partial [Xanthomonas oryzae pv. oryzae]
MEGRSPQERPPHEPPESAHCAQPEWRPAHPGSGLRAKPATPGTGDRPTGAGRCRARLAGRHQRPRRA